MGLTYDQADSSSVKDALSRNLAAAATVLHATEAASQRLSAALSGEELSGQGYSAIEALFAQVIAPCLRDTKNALGSIQGELEVYTHADSRISQYGVLKEDELHTQLEATRRQRDATEQLMEVNRSVADALTAVPMLGETLHLANRQLELVISQLDADLRDLEERLHALREFDAATRGLFQHGLGDSVAMRLVAAAGSRTDPQKGGVSLAAFFGGMSAATWTTSDLMNLLVLLDPNEVEDLLAENPRLAQRFWDTPPPAESVATWWKTLAPAQREKWCQVAPQIIGNLPGLDADTRIHANAIQFQRDLYDPSIAPDSPRGIVLRDILKALKVDRISGPGLDYEKLAKSQTPPRGLLAYNAAHEPPLAAVAIGETAAEKSGKVTWTVPGMNSGLGEPGRLAGWTNSSVNLYNEQEDVERGVPHMVVAWVGYEPPGMDSSVLEGDRAQTGAGRLSRELDGQWAADTILGGNPKPFTAVLGHSYGTTVVTNAVSSGGGAAHNVQSVVLLASAGVEKNIPTAGALMVDGGAARVYASQSSQDPVADAGRFGSGRADPRDAAFGAKVFSSEGDTAHELEPTDGHDVIGYGSDRGGPWVWSHATKRHGYLNPGTEALHNSAAATLGLDGEINGGTR